MAEPKEKDNGTTARAPGEDTAQGGDGSAGSELEALRGRVQAAEQERDEYLNLAQRVKADFENYQKRQQRDLAEERRYAEAPLARDLLPALDNLERALGAARKAGDEDPLVQGVAMVQAQMLDALRRHGVTRLEAEGKPFDPHREEAVMQRPSKDVPPGTVLEVLEPGYLIHDRVLRAAKVVVSAPEG